MNAHARMAAAMQALIEARTEPPLAGLGVVSAGQVVTTARGVRARDWIDEAMDRSIRRFEYPLDTPSKRRLTASALRHHEGGLMSRTITIAQLHAEARARFGPDPDTWAYQCPECGDVATRPDVAYVLSQQPPGFAAAHARVSASQILGQRCLACPALAREFPYLDRVHDPDTGRTAAVFNLAPTKETAR